MEDQEHSLNKDDSNDEDEDLSNNRPVAPEILQSRLPPGFTLHPHGQREMLTGPDGRQFITQLYEQTPNDSATPVIGSSEPGENSSSASEMMSNAVSNTSHASDTGEQSESDVARVLCVNLLSELVKGSCQLFKNRGHNLKSSTRQEAVNKLHNIEKKCENLKAKLCDTQCEELDVEESSLSSSDSNSNRGGQINKSAENTDTDSASGHSGDQRKRKSSSTFSDNCQNGFKKARHSWQIKGTNNSNNCAKNETSNKTDSVSRGSHCVGEPSIASHTERTSGQLVSCVGEPSSASQTEGTSGRLVSCVGEPNSASHTEGTSGQLVHTEDSSALTCKALPSCSADKNSVVEASSSAALSGDESLTSEDDTALSTSSSEYKVSYLEQWQNHHIAKAVVDNAINKTLDEMNLGPQETSPIQSGTNFSMQRQRIEDAGVSQVILQRGLRHQNVDQPTLPQTRSSQTAPVRTTSNQSTSSTDAPPQPFFNNLTELTENMFVGNLREGIRFSARIDTEGNVRFISSPIHRDSNSVAIGVQPHSNANTIVRRQITAAAISIDRTSPTQDASATEQNEEPFCNVSNSNVGVSSSSNQQTEHRSSLINANVTGFDNVNSCKAMSSAASNQREMDTKSDKQTDDFIESQTDRSALDVIEEIEKNAPSQNFVLDTAVNAVISERGLQF